MELREKILAIWGTCCFVFLSNVEFADSDFVGVTNRVLGGPLEGLMATFGDFDMDKKTDIFVISDDGHSVKMYARDGNSTDLLHLTSSATIERPDDTITSVTAGDFDGDFQMDVLLTIKPTQDPFNTSIPTKVYIYWGNITHMTYGPATLVTDVFADQPLVMDCNADMIPDIFGENINDHKKICISVVNQSRLFEEKEIVGRDGYHLVVPNSNAFLDLTGNYAANLVMVTKQQDTGTVAFEVYSYMPEDVDGLISMWQYSAEDSYSPPSGVQFEHLGVSTFADMNADSFLDHILPICYNTDCTSGAIYVKFHGPISLPWQEIFNLSQLTYDQTSWGFVPPTTRLVEYTELPLVARPGDYDLDTLTDVLILVQGVVNGVSQRRVVLLKNTGNGLVPVWTTPNDVIAPVLATFMDIQRVGQLDLMIVNQTMAGDSEIYLIDNSLSVDAYFVQTDVLSALCKTKCPVGESNIPSGVTQPGPIVRYDTTSSTGQPQQTGGCQMSQSAYFSLQLPYVVLGLGQNPNFVDYLRLGVPGSSMPDKRNKRVHEWTSIIPNSQLIVIPDPLDSPDDWLSKILIIPGQSVLLTGVVLICTCVVLALTAALLHLKERKDDEKEKRQEAHLFHFDAM